MHGSLRLLSFAAVVAAVSTLAGPAASSSTGSGPRATRVLVNKSEHTLTLYDGDEVLASYHAAIGPGGAGPKHREGDMVTPVGRYHVVLHQPSQYKVFLRLDYPNAADRARFAALKKEGALPKGATIGGDIGIHGPPQSLPGEARATINASDWTAGCIAVGDDEIAAVARAVRDGTVVDIED